MTKLEAQIMGYICCVMGVAFDYLRTPWLALVFLFGAAGFLGWSIYKQHGGGGGPLKPA